MAICGSSILTFPFPISQLKNEASNPNYVQFVGNFPSQKPLNVFSCSLDDGGAKLEKEKLKFRWLDVGGSIGEAKKKMISGLPDKMSKRCKAVLRQIICSSYEAQGAGLADLLCAWVRIMKPRRTDWLSILKHLKTVEHPVYLEVFEHALLEESFEANVRDYTKVIHCYGKQNQLQLAENILLAMKERGFVIDEVTLTTMIHIYSKAGKLEQAEETFEEIKLLGLPLDRRAYDSMIMAYIRADMPREGEILLREMNTREIYAGTEVYKALLRAYCMAGDADGAQRVFDSIQFAGIPPDARMCGLLINAYLMADQNQKALIAFQNMRKAGLEPSDKCVALALGAYEMDNDLDGALSILIRLEREGIMVGKEASEVLARWFKRLGVVKEVELVLREYVAKEVSC
ncbi:Tetratricopeptide repeat (TPR)-like superfamily protein [Euphorbia peplus]|nr:Tetratricopeptide repeat (TPR)-like superfamily protein [Euphorbia peplus]